MAGIRSKTSGSDHNVMRELNRSLVLDLLKQHDAISRATIAKAAGLAKPTVSAIIDELIQKGLVREIGIGETTTGGGRPPIMLEFNARSQFVAGVTIGVQRIQVAIADARGQEITRAERPTPRKPAADVLAVVVEMVRAALKDGDVPKTKLAAVGVCVPGLTDFDAGVCLLAPNLKWRDVPVAAPLKKALGVPVFVHNTAQAAAVAEGLEGEGRGTENLIFLFAGSGIGAGILSDGRLFHGSSGIAGEVGHCPIPGAEFVCNCGKVGCLETVASGNAIAKFARDFIDQGRESSLAALGSKLTTEDVAKAAAEGDQLAVDLMRTAGWALGIGVSWLVNLINPELVVVGGGLARAGDPLLGMLREAVEQLALPQASSRVEIRVSSLGDDARVRGAVLLALQYSEQYYRVIFQS